MGKKFWANIILCAFIGVLASVVLANINLTPKGMQVTDPEPSSEAAPFMDKVTLADYKLAKGAEHVVMGEFTVSNISDKEIKNIDVLCEFFDGSGKYLDREQWLLAGRVPAGKTLRHSSAARRFVHTGSQNIECRIVDFQVAQAPFFELHRVEGGHGSGGHGEAASSNGHGAADQGHH